MGLVDLLVIILDIEIVFVILQILCQIKIKLMEGFLLVIDVVDNFAGASCMAQHVEAVDFEKFCQR